MKKMLILLFTLFSILFVSCFQNSKSNEEFPLDNKHIKKYIKEIMETKFPFTSYDPPSEYIEMVSNNSIELDYFVECLNNKKDWIRVAALFVLQDKTKDKFGDPNIMYSNAEKFDDERKKIYNYWKTLSKNNSQN